MCLDISVAKTYEKHTSYSSKQKHLLLFNLESNNCSWRHTMSMTILRSDCLCFLVKFWKMSQFSSCRSLKPTARWWFSSTDESLYMRANSESAETQVNTVNSLTRPWPCAYLCITHSETPPLNLCEITVCDACTQKPLAPMRLNGIYPSFQGISSAYVTIKLCKQTAGWVELRCAGLMGFTPIHCQLYLLKRFTQHTITKPHTQVLKQSNPATIWSTYILYVI